MMGPMATFAFRKDFPKGPGENWDRKQVAGALRQARTVGRMTGERDPFSTVLGAVDALEERSKLPAKKFSKEWSDNRDREILSRHLETIGASAAIRKTGRRPE